MITRTFKKTGEQLSHLGFGGMRFPVREDNTIDREKAGEMLDYAYARGVNYYDTAYGYHNGESAKFFGDFLCETRKNEIPRKSIKIANKFPLWGVNEKDDIQKIFDYQLASLKTDYIDFYLMHAMNGELWEKSEKFGIYDFCRRKKEEGVVRNFGFSFHGSNETLIKMLDEGVWDFVQIQFNYLDYFTGSAKFEYDEITKRGIPVMVMEPIRGGSLAALPEEAMKILRSATDSTPAEFALRFCSSFKNVLVILSGMSTLEQTKQNIETFENIKPLSAEEMNAAMRIVAALEKGKFVPCTGCRYCVEECPMDIKIPEVFAEYNAYLAGIPSEGEKAPAVPDDLKESAANCIGCGSCAARCPQGIAIPEIMDIIRNKA
ncbi:MAG: aldo/keto reductase [Oscillospiraceae bacterium]|nr:aldo/keto reductase [Oscillospiraceae bacterium]